MTLPTSRRGPAVLVASLLGMSLAACSLGGEDDPPVSVDAAVPPDAAVTDPCAACTADQICVQFLDGVCRSESVSCMPRHPACIGNACSLECMQWQCNGGSTPPFRRCDVGGCAADVPGALHCYGP